MGSVVSKLFSDALYGGCHTWGGSWQDARSVVTMVLIRHSKDLGTLFFSQKEASISSSVNTLVLSESAGRIIL